MMEVKKLCCAAALAGLVTVGLAYGQQPGAQRPSEAEETGAGIHAYDNKFALDAVSGGMAEVRLGQLAESNGSNTAVKEFGKQMQTDHGKANDQLKGIMSKDNVPVSRGMNEQDQATYDKLSKLTGAAFDKAYAKQMVEDHQKDIAAFQREASSGQNPDLKNFAQQTLPTLQNHLQMAQSLEEKIGQ